MRISEGAIVDRSIDRSTPLVTVTVLNYRRRRSLERALASIAAQRYSRVETIVVDNGSGPETTAFVRDNFSWASLIALDQNRGAASRNHGIAAARGDIVVTIDNDIHFRDPDALDRIVAAFDRHPDAACVVFRILDPATGRCHSRDWHHPRPLADAAGQEFRTSVITEGAAAFRREVFDRVEPYWEELFLGLEGIDLTDRILEAGAQIWYVPGVAVYHRYDTEAREPGRPFYHRAKGIFLIAWRNYPVRLWLTYSLPRLLMLGFYALKYGHMRRFLRGIRDGLAGCWRLRGERRPLQPEVWRTIAELKRSQPSPLARFRRHWSRPEL